MTFINQRMSNDLDNHITGHYGEDFFKRKGEEVFARWLDRWCKCGCRLRTDGKVIWCSGIKCDYFVKLLTRSTKEGKRDNISQIYTGWRR